MANRKTIMIIEDQPDFLRIYGDLFESKGYNTISASDGVKGWELLAQMKPDLVLLDLVLPGMSGFDILTKVKENPETKAIPIIIFSVLGEGENIQKALAMGASDYAVKGYYKPADLLEKIERLLQLPEAAQKVPMYEVTVRENALDYPKLVKELRLPENLVCTECNTTLVLKMLADFTHEHEHWFNSHLYCPKCQKIY